MKFSEAIEALQKGGLATRYSSPAFFGKKIVKQIPQTVPADVVPKMTSLPDGIKAEIGTCGLESDTKGTISYHDQVLIVTIRDDEPVTATSYTPTWEDIFAEDWAIEVPAEAAEKMAVEPTSMDTIRPRWNAEHNGVFVPIINKIVQLKDLSKGANWHEAMELAKKAGGELMSHKDVDIIHFFLEDINRILLEHGGEPLEGYHWTSLEYSATIAWIVNFSSGQLSTNNFKGYSYVVRAVVAL